MPEACDPVGMDQETLGAGQTHLAVQNQMVLYGAAKACPEPEPRA